MNDMFDEELMKELGLDPAELQEEQPVAKPKPAQRPAAAPAGTQPLPRPAAPRPNVAPQRPAVRPQGTTAEEEAPVPPKPAPQVQKPQPKPQPKPVSAEDQAQKISHEIPIQLAAVLAKKTLRLSDILALNVGEVIEFKKATTEPIDLVANGKLVAKADLVMVEGKLGARIVKLVR